MSNDQFDQPRILGERRYPNRDLIRELARRHTEEILVTARKGQDLKRLEQDHDDELIRILQDIPGDDRPAFERVYREEAEVIYQKMQGEAERIADSRDNVMLVYLLIAAAIFFTLGFAWKWIAG
ncbi:MAG: hypothetical protein Alpg2KO_13940 [Alphaproteobacteria bacterium]